MFDKLISRIEKRDGKLYVYEGKYQGERTNYDFIKKFPSELFDNEEDKLAVLSHLSCSEMGWLYEIIQYVLSGK